MNASGRVIINAVWDDEARVWAATSDDVPGLATEADDLEVLVEKLKKMIPELLDTNGVAHGEDVPFEILGQRFGGPPRSRLSAWATGGWLRNTGLVRSGVPPSFGVRKVKGLLADPYELNSQPPSSLDCPFALREH